MRRSRRYWLTFAALVSAAAGPFAAGAAANAPVSLPATEIGAVRLEHRTGARRAALLVPVRYPRYMAGRTANVRVQVLGAQRRTSATVRLSAGLQRRPVRRRAFSFVHRVPLGQSVSARLAAGERLRVRVRAVGRLDADRDGRAEARSGDVSLQHVRRARRVRARLTCGSMPVVTARPRQAVTMDLPSCDSPVRWSVGKAPRHGKVSRAGGRIVYRPARDHRGLDELVLRARPAGTGPARASSAAAPAVTVPVRIHVGPRATAGLTVRAMGDSVTAGFGYYSNGSAMTFSSLPGCRPGNNYNDACSSNSLTTSSSQGGLKFAPDYGLSNNVSWAAQWANEHGITDYANLAVTGSAPGDWAQGGSLYGLTQSIEADDPDYVVLTVGANPLLSDVLFGRDTMGCALKSDLFGNFTECVLEAFERVNLQAYLTAIYDELLLTTNATILLMQYHLSIPSIALVYSSTQIAQMDNLLNSTIASVASSLVNARLQVVSPPRFNVGIDMTPLTPNNYTCSLFGYGVDGPSAQATVTQDELIVNHPLSFCSGPVGGGPPWVISADTGIHPSAAGYTQMASALPAP